jgi:hypothetical protein
MDATAGNGELGNELGSEEVRELARRSGDGIDVALLWDSAANRVFVVVDDERRDERFWIAVRNGSALDAFHHPYAYPAERAA